MSESEQLSEAEATVALDRKTMQIECLPDCPTDGAYGCTGTCPCNCHDESGTRLVVPDAVRLHHTELAKYLKPGASGEYFYNFGAVQAQAEKAYPMGFDDGWKARDAEVTELKEQLKESVDEGTGFLARGDRAFKERDAALAERDEAAERTRYMTSRRDDILDQATGIEVERDAALEQMRALVEAGEKNGEKS